MNKMPAPMNRSIKLTDEDIKKYSSRLLKLYKHVDAHKILDKTINQDLFEALKYLPDSFIDLLFIDPPYNLKKNFNKTTFRTKTVMDYADFIESFISGLIRCLKPNASIYVCGDWKSSTSIHMVLEKYFKVKNRITWEREKGRGSKSNWKNNTEDIWFCTRTQDYTFNYNDVKLKRKVKAPYRRENGEPKDWQVTDLGGFRMTYSSNIWNDLSVPFWSMPENTEHPTQKPEKLLAKIIIASSNKKEVIFDPFLGSGTTSVVAKKLNRHFVGIEIDNKYACLAEKRLELAETDKSIQGYDNGIFWERNSSPKKSVK
jgi:site-specific DNA-methyltransferase (adenine-specific)